MSIAKRLNKDIKDLENVPDSDPVWPIIGHYLTLFCANLAYVLSPEVIILGGGVMNRKILYKLI